MVAKVRNKICSGLKKKKYKKKLMGVYSIGKAYRLQVGWRGKGRLQSNVKRVKEEQGVPQGNDEQGLG